MNHALAAVAEEQISFVDADEVPSATHGHNLGETEALEKFWICLKLFELLIWRDVEVLICYVLNTCKIASSDCYREKVKRDINTAMEPQLP